MDLRTLISIAVVVAIGAYLARRWVYRVLVSRRQRKELVHAREARRSPDTIRILKTRHAFERGESTQAMKLLGKNEPDS